METQRGKEMYDFISKGIGVAWHIKDSEVAVIMINLEWAGRVDGGVKC